MKKKMKSKGYAKGGAKMMKARSGKMMKSKGGAKMMKAMGGRMMKSKGYAKGGAKMMKAKRGNMANKPTMTLAQAKKVLKQNNMKAVKV